MQVRSKIITVSLVLFVSMSPALRGQIETNIDSPPARRFALNRLLETIEGEPTEELPRIIRSKDEYLRHIGAAAYTYFAVDSNQFDTPEQIADAFLAQNRNLFVNISSDIGFKEVRVKTRDNVESKLPRTFVRYQQTYSGLDVYGAETIIQVNGLDGVACALSNLMQDTTPLDSNEVSLTPAICASTAEQKAIDYLEGQHDELQFEASDARLLLYEPSIVDRKGPPQLVWQTTVGNIGESVVKESVFVDAHTGQIVYHYPLIYDAIYREVWDFNNTTSNSIPVLKENDGNYPTGIDDIDNAWNYLKDTYDFYYDHHNRRGHDANDANMVAKVRYGICVAFWRPTPNDYILLGTGFVADDVVGHEFTHGVTISESNLAYAGESGAINESLSNMWGEWVDQGNGDGNDTPAAKWIVGEDVTCVEIRYSMKNPPDYNQPDCMSSPYWDECGSSVHCMGGVGNKLCYLLTDGNSFNGYTISSMGVSITADLFYECQTNLLGETSNYEHLGFALTQAAINLDLSQSERENVWKACMAVEIIGKIHNITQERAYYSTIQGAINDANDEDVIELFPSTYYETIDFNTVSCTLRSTQPEDSNVVARTIIDANNSSATVITLNPSQDANCIITGLTIRGGSIGIDCNNATPNISECVIEDNTTYGIHCRGSASPEITKCTIRGNAKGIYCSANSTPTIACSKICDNNNDGIRIYSSKPVTVKSNQIYSNDYGIKCSDANSSTVIRNNTLYKNTTSGIYVVSGSEPNVSNCIIWDCNDDLYDCNATYSCIQDGDTGTGNISTDPNLRDPDSNDFHLDVNSPCIDAGDPNASYSGENDIDGSPSPRVMGGRVDIGSDEDFPNCHPDYNEWVAVGRPVSWCNPRQCHGDADGKQEQYGFEWVYVGDDDLEILLDGWLEDYNDPETNPWIAADFDHNAEQYGFITVRVGYDDLNILISNWLSNPDPNCLDCP